MSWVRCSSPAQEEPCICSQAPHSVPPHGWSHPPPMYTNHVPLHRALPMYAGHPCVGLYVESLHMGLFWREGGSLREKWPAHRPHHHHHCACAVLSCPNTQPLPQ
eukprot:c14860_g1_i1 orf=582-896(-)